MNDGMPHSLPSTPLTAATTGTHNRQTFIEQTHRRLKSHLAVGSRLRQRLHQPKSENSPNLLSSIPLTAATTGTHNRPTFIELWFHSSWCQNSMQLQEVDALELCPQGQFWPKQQTKILRHQVEGQSVGRSQIHTRKSSRWFVCRWAAMSGIGISLGWTTCCKHCAWIRYNFAE